MGPFRKCTCSTDRSRRSFRFEGFSHEGHDVGAASVLIHDFTCQGLKGGAKPTVWLFKCKDSTVAKIDHNNYLHPHADHRGLFTMPPRQRDIMWDHVSKGEWEAAIKVVRTSLSRVYGVGKDRLEFFPTVTAPQMRPKKTSKLAADTPPKPLATRFVQGFTVDGKVLGPYFIDLHKVSQTYCDIRLRGTDHTAVAWKDDAAQPNLHPHSGCNGRLDISPLAPSIGAIGDPDETLFAAEQYLRTGIQNQDAYLKLQYWPDATAPESQAYEHDDPYKDLCETNEAVSHLMKPFKIRGRELGPILLVLDKKTFKVKAYSDGRNTSPHGHIHPHIDTTGYICFGQPWHHLAFAPKSKASPEEMLYHVARYLRTVYAGSDAYCRIEQWKETKKVYTLNVRMTTSNGSEMECWGVFSSYQAAHKRIGDTPGIDWSSIDGCSNAAAGEPNEKYDGEFGSLVEAYATIDTHDLQE